MKVKDFGLLACEMILNRRLSDRPNAQHLDKPLLLFNDDVVALAFDNVGSLHDFLSRLESIGTIYNC